MAYSPADADPDTDGHQVDLELGDNTVTVTVTAEDETTKEYTLTINRTLTGGAYLSALSVGGIGIEGFVATTPDYTVTVGNSIERATIALATVDGNASVTYSTADAGSSAAGYQVDLGSGVQRRDDNRHRPGGRHSRLHPQHQPGGQRQRQPERPDL